MPGKKIILIITYYWPPCGGAGVQRWLKFAKYLPEFGWEPIILTVDPEFATYPAIDTSLTSDIRDDLVVHSTKAINYFNLFNRKKTAAAGDLTFRKNSFKNKLVRFIRGNFFIPDPRKGWNRFAVKKASELIVSQDIKYVITTSPPHSAQLIGLKLKKKFPGLIWVADLRDPWTDIYYYKMFYPTFLSRALDKRLEKSVLISADKIVTVGNSLKDLFIAKLSLINDKIHVLTNGYDEEDFAGLSKTEPDVFTITYVGALTDSYPITGFLEAISDISQAGNIIILRFVGSVSPEQLKLIQDRSNNLQLEVIPYADHRKAIEYMINSSLLLLVIPDHPRNDLIITGKIFEYLGSETPVLGIGPTDGDANKILETSDSGKMFSYSNTSGIIEYISNLDNNQKSQKAEIKYSRKAITKLLIKILEKD